MNTKNKPAIHLNKRDTIVFTSTTSGKQTTFPIQGVEVDEEYTHPVRVHLRTPVEGDKKATTVVGFGWREQAEVVA